MAKILLANAMLCICCTDVLVEIINFLTRRELHNLEQACRYFHRIIAEKFSKIPFLAFELKCYFDGCFFLSRRIQMKQENLVTFLEYFLIYWQKYKHMGPNYLVILVS